MALEQNSEPSKLGMEFEIDQYIRALGASSSRVRFVMLAIIISSIAAASTLWSERTNAWARHRLTTEAENSDLAEKCNLWNDFSKGVGCAKELARNGLLHQSRLDPGQLLAKEKIVLQHGFDTRKCLRVCDAADSLSRYGVTTSSGAISFAQKQQEAYINNVLYVRTPVLGLTFDINDLGLITGVTFCILMLVMVFYTHRAHENLVLAMWKVQEIAEEEGCFDVPGSKANLLYHTLAMEQVFTVPPTLARWNDFQFFRRAHYLLFFAPFVVQILVFGNDLQSAGIGAAFSDRETRISLSVQAILILAVIPLCILCCSHLHGDDVLWDRVFLFINPAHRFKGKANWLHWVRLFRQQPPSWGIVGRKEEGRTQLYFSDSVRDIVWKLDVASGQLSESSHRHGHGLLLSEDKSIHIYSRILKSRHQFERCAAHGEVISWPRAGVGEARAKLEVINKLGKGCEFELSRRQIILKPGSEDEIKVGGGGHSQRDGTNDIAGFDSIHAVLPHEGSLMVTDGAWLREVEMNGKVSTWGGKPLGQVVRRERALLLGMAAVDRTKAIVFQSGASVSGEHLFPKLLVCDFSLRRVFGVRETSAKEVYRSEPSWSPSGIWIDGSDVYLLEYRAYLIKGETYLRILKFTGMDFRQQPTNLVGLPSRKF
jgi:hypothetical protein